VIDLHPLVNHPIDYLWLVALIWPKTVNFWAIYDPETVRDESFLFNAGPVKATCAECQNLCVTPTLNVKTSMLHLRWNSPCLVQLWFLVSSAQFSSLFLQPVISQCTYLKPPFFASIPPRLYKETVFVLCVFLTSFAVSHYESELVLLWPLRSRPVVSVVLILGVSFFAVHSWLSFFFRHIVWIYAFLVLKQAFYFGLKTCFFSLEIEFKVMQQLSF